MTEFTVKARRRQGTNSLDLTIPTEIVKEQNVSPGDVFKIKMDKEGSTLTLIYTCVYKKK